MLWRHPVPHVCLTGPGLIALTVKRSANSLAQVRVIASKADFVPPYTDWPTKPSVEDVDERLTVRPLLSQGRYGKAACINSSGPRTLILYI